MSDTSPRPLVGILMGSKSDWETMQAAAKILDEFGIPHEAKVASAHRSPALVTEFVTTAEQRGLEVIIAAAGLAAHLPGVVAAQTLLPVLGVPMQSPALGGLDALLAIAQMPGQSVPTAPRIPPCSRFGSWPTRDRGCGRSWLRITRRWQSR
jgi:5-(carboxyamino)imidazole ribonucleotide mutase